MHLLNILPIGLFLAQLSTAAALPAPPASGTCKNPPKRMEWRQLSTPQKKEYIDAVLCLSKKKAISGLPGATNRFEDHLVVHNDQTPDIHWVGKFVLWHRYFVATYEKALRDECGYKGGQPYWDYSKDADPKNPESMKVFESAIFDAKTGFGGNGEFRESTPENNAYGMEGGTGGGCVKDGPFTPDKFKLHFPNPEGECLRRDFIPRLMNLFADQSLVDELMKQKDYTSFARTMEKERDFGVPNIHGSGHFGVGGGQGQGGDAFLSPSEPLFYLHHGNLDHIFWRWQQKDLKRRLHQVGGPIMPFDYSGKNVTLDFKTNIGKLAPDVTLEDLLNTEGGTLCYTY